MSKIITLESELKEIEDITDINGCFLLKAIDHTVIESTIPLKIHDDILWEVGVLRDTFQQFSRSLEHGYLNQIALEGEKGFIFLYRLSGDFILLALAPKSINLGYLKLAMIDIILRINTKIDSLSEEEISLIMQSCHDEQEKAMKIKAAPTEQTVLQEARDKGIDVDNLEKSALENLQSSRPQEEELHAPAVPKFVGKKEKVEAGKAPGVLTPSTAPTTPKIPTTPKKEIAAPSVPSPKAVKVFKTEVADETSAVAETPTAASIKAKTTIEQKMESVAPSRALSESNQQSTVSTQSQAQSVFEKTHNLQEILNSLKKSEDKEFLSHLKQFFKLFQIKSDELMGMELAKHLEMVKELILDKIGSSLALFDLGRAARELKNKNCQLQEGEISKLKTRVDNWVSRLIP